MDINYELYKVFYYVATSLSFSEASKQLYISQSAVSQSIKALEKKLDQTLFIRSTKKVRLTTEGEILLRHIEPAISLIRRGESQLLESITTGGQIRIAASDTICRYFLVPYIERFHQAFPNLHIKIINATSIRCVDILKNGQADFIVIDQIQCPHAAARQRFHRVAAHAADAEHRHAGIVQFFHSFRAQQQLRAGILILHFVLLVTFPLS